MLIVAPSRSPWAITPHSRMAEAAAAPGWKIPLTWAAITCRAPVDVMGIVLAPELFPCPTSMVSVAVLAPAPQSRMT